MKSKIKYLIPLLFILIYIALHIYYPNEQVNINSITGNYVNWDSVKHNFEDENNNSYFLSYDSYFYVDQVNKINRGELTFRLAEDPILTYLTYMDYKIFGKFFLAHYFSAFFGLLCLLIVLFLIYDISF